MLEVSETDKTTQSLSIFVLQGSQIDKLIHVCGYGQKLVHAQLWPYQFNSSSYATDPNFDQILCLNMVLPRVYNRRERESILLCIWLCKRIADN